MIEGIFARIKEPPGEQIIAAQFEERITSCRTNLEQARTSLNTELLVLSMLENELIKVLQGTSRLKPEMLNKKHAEAESSAAVKQAIVEKLEAELANSEEVKCQVTRQYTDVLSWADMYSQSPMDVKKMIVSQLIGEIRVSRDYQIEIDFKISERQLGLERKPVLGQKTKKRRDDPAL